MHPCGLQLVQITIISEHLYLIFLLFLQISVNPSIKLSELFVTNRPDSKFSRVEANSRPDSINSSAVQNSTHQRFTVQTFGAAIAILFDDGCSLEISSSKSVLRRIGAITVSQLPVKSRCQLRKEVAPARGELAVSAAASLVSASATRELGSVDPPRKKVLLLG